MTSIFKRLLIPGFLRRLDAYLLVRNPVLWRTQVHFVLFYALVGAVVLFLAGFYAEVSAVHLQVEPVKPIEMVEDDQYIYTFIFVFASSLYWAYSQFQAGYPLYKPLDTLGTISIYVFCWWILLGITAPAFRMGTIYKTGWCWMDDDLNQIEKSNIYPYGIVLLKSDSTFQIQADSFYQQRENIFKEKWREEDEFLTYRYETDTMRLPERIRNIDFNGELPNVNVSYLNKRSYLAAYSGLTHPIERGHIPMLLNISSPKGWPFEMYWSYMTYRYQYTLFSLDRLYAQDYFNRSISRYNNFPSWLIDKYKFKTGLDTIPDDSVVFRPQLPNSVEDAVRSVKHSQQYIEKGMFQRFLLHLRFYIFFPVILLFLLPFTSLRHVLLTLVIGILGWAFLSMKWVKLEGFINGDFEKGYWVNVASFTILPLTGVLLLVFSAWSKKQFQLVPLAAALLFSGLFLTLYPTLGIMQENFKNLGLPYNHAFFGVQILGLAGAFLLTYIHSLPKKT